jgi:hypothetical protein
MIAIRSQLQIRDDRAMVAARRSEDADPADPMLLDTRT